MYPLTGRGRLLGTVVAWTTDAWLAQVICKLLSDNEELLRRKEEKDGTR